ncbi:MAG: glycosyltransferase family 2 protein, partial [Chloroflexi bacterium]|nr:glycosyltransferase family 2 protein [Chloroflexota bacterium]
MSALDVETRTQIDYQRTDRIEPSGEKPQGLKLVVVIPAYNEARFIGSTVLKALDFTDYVLVVDDGSDDETARIAEAAGASVVRHECNLGKGAALNSGLRECRQLGAQCVVTLDADGQHLPEEMQQVLAPILEESADLVIGSRYLEIGNQVPRHRIWGHRAFNLLTKWGSGVQVSDSQSGYRAFSARALEAIYFTSQGFSVESEMQFLAREKELKVVEVPVTIRYQDQPKRSVMLQGMLVLNGVLRLVGQHRPLFYFGVPGAFFLASGIGCGLWVVDIYRRSAQLAVGYTLV